MSFLFFFLSVSWLSLFSHLATLSTSIRSLFFPLSYWNVWTLQNKRLYVKKESKGKKNIDTDTPKSFQEIPWQNETLPFVGKFSKATTTIATAILDLTRCRQRLSAPTFQCNVCVCVSRRVDLSVCMRYFFNSTIVSGALSRCSHSPWWLRF